MPLQRHKWYRYYDNFIKYFQPIIISYSDLATKPDETIKKLCNEIKIPYFIDKTEFWKFESHHIFGASSVRIQYQKK
jgi:hypothetical protein